MSNTKKDNTMTYSVCHNVDGLNGFFILNNRDHLCETLEDAVALAERFNQVTNSRNYRATGTMHFVTGGYNSSVVWRCIGVMTKSGEQHSNFGWCEYPVKWITLEEYETEKRQLTLYEAFGDLNANYYKFAKGHTYEDYINSLN